MNILFFGYSVKSTAGGAERYCYNILKELSKRGHKIYIYTVSAADEDPDFIYLNKYVKRIKYVDRFLLGRRIAGYLKKENVQIDLFLSGHLFLYEKCEQLSRQLGVPYDLFVYGIDCWGGRFAERMAGMKNLRKVISISSFTTEQVRKEGWKGDVVYFPPLIDTATLPELPQHALAPTGKMVLLTVGRLDAAEQYKGHDAVIRALEIVRREIPNIAYWIAGRGNDMPRLEALAQEKKVDDCTTFWGFVDAPKLAELYAQSDIFIMASRVSLDPNKLEGEGFGIVFTEAALYDKALIGPNTGGSMDIIDHEVNGLTCDPEDVEAIAATIIRLAKDEALRKRIGQNAKQKTLENFTINQFDRYFKDVR
jgi:glycosyltransferase involved in cell wall biosynthesis